MLPTLEGIIARRVLLNFRADPEEVQRQLPEPFEVLEWNRFAVVGVCLIRLEQLRPKGLSPAFGIASENMAHRVAVQYPTADGMKPGVYVWGRATNQCWAAALGGRIFPGVHERARFEVVDFENYLAMTVRTNRQQKDVSFTATIPDRFRPTPLFNSLGRATGFFRSGECGFSCATNGRTFEGMWLRTLQWSMQPLQLSQLRAKFFENAGRFPRGSLEFDSAFLMRRIEHEWHTIPDLTAAVNARRRLAPPTPSTETPPAAPS